MKRNKAGWSGGIAEWTEGETAFISVAFTWLLDAAYTRALWFRSLGYHVRVGGPAVFLVKPRRGLESVAEIGGEIPEAVRYHNPDATFASRGCPVGCWFCIVPKMEGRQFTLIPDFPVRPILCDNNLSALPADYQEHIIRRYQDEGVRLLDANSGFEPRTFTPEVYARWQVINDGPWRFAYDDMTERKHVKRVLDMLVDEPGKRKRIYVLIGNEPVDDCMRRIHEVIRWGGEPYAQAYIKLNAIEKKPHVRFDWTPQLLIDVPRWVNRHLWRGLDFATYRRGKKGAPEIYDGQQGLFV